MHSEKKYCPPVTRPDPDDLIPLAELVKHIPLSRRGKRRHVSTVYRYTLRGVRGVRLDSQQLPDGKYTTLAAWTQFVQRLTARHSQNPVPRPAASPHVRSKRQHTVEAEIDHLRATLRRKGSVDGDMNPPRG